MFDQGTGFTAGLAYTKDMDLLPSGHYLMKNLVTVVM